MKTIGFLCGIGMLLAQTSAFAQMTAPTVRVDNAIAVAADHPQTDDFGPGGAAALKLGFNVVPWLDIDPSVGTVQLSKGEYVSPGNPGSSVAGTWALGLGARLKRPHNVNVSANSYWGPASPWIDADVQYFNTGGLNRAGASVGAGLSMPLDLDRHYWLGPMFRYTQITDGTSVGGIVGYDHRDARIAEFGLEFEFDFSSGYKRPAPPVHAPVIEEKPLAKVITIPPPPEESPKTPQMMKRFVHATTPIKVQFDFDSAVLTPTYTHQLDQVAESITAGLANTDQNQPQITAVEVDGHASSENHPLAEKHNMDLSVARAQAVTDYLVSKGVPRTMLTVKGFGTTKPIADNATEEGRRTNRRVEFDATISVTTGGTP